MTTVVELRAKARKLEIKGYSSLNKRDLELAVYQAERKREDAQLDAIRKAGGPEIEKVATLPQIPTQPLDIDSIGFTAEDIQTPKGVGISNRIRAAHYLAQDIGRTKLTPAMARRMRKKRKAGDYSMALAACFPDVNVLIYL